MTADLELEGVVEAALERFGQGSEHERELWHSGQQVGVVLDVSWCGGFELGEFFSAGPVLGGQFSEEPTRRSAASDHSNLFGIRI